jgi:hypothetical protein
MTSVKVQEEETGLVIEAMGPVRTSLSVQISNFFSSRLLSDGSTLVYGVLHTARNQES